MRDTDQQGNRQKKFVYLSENAVFFVSNTVPLFPKLMSVTCWTAETFNRNVTSKDAQKLQNHRILLSFGMEDHLH